MIYRNTALPFQNVLKSLIKTDKKNQIGVCALTQSCLTLCSLMDCSLPGSTVLGIFQARKLKQVATSYSNW